MNGLHVQMQPVRFKVERCEAVQQRSPDCLLQDLSLPHCAKQWAKRLDGVVYLAASTSVNALLRCYQ